MVHFKVSLKLWQTMLTVFSPLCFTSVSVLSHRCISSHTDTILLQSTCWQPACFFADQCSVCGGASNFVLSLSHKAGLLSQDHSRKEDWLTNWSQGCVTQRVKYIQSIVLRIWVIIGYFLEGRLAVNKERTFRKMRKCQIVFAFVPAYFSENGKVHLLNFLNATVISVSM